MLTLLLLAAMGLPGGECTPTPNSTGLPGILTQTGPTTFTASQLPSMGVFAGLFGGPEPIDLPFGDGRICVTPALGWWRLPSAEPVVNGTVTFDASPILSPGMTAYVQCWYRDPGFGDHNFNLTNRVLWDPGDPGE